MKKRLGDHAAVQARPLGDLSGVERVLEISGRELTKSGLSGELAKPCLRLRCQYTAKPLAGGLQVR